MQNDFHKQDTKVRTKYKQTLKCISVKLITFCKMKLLISRIAITYVEIDICPLKSHFAAKMLVLGVF